MDSKLELAVNAALSGDWHAAHNIAQNMEEADAHLLHAILHKIEGDQWNSKYWYARSGGRHYEDYSDATEELKSMLKHLQSHKQ
jgi:phage gp29-like protein